MIEPNTDRGARRRETEGEREKNKQRGAREERRPRRSRVRESQTVREEK